MPEQPPDRWTVLTLLNWTKQYLAREQVDQPRLAAEVLLAHALGCDRIDLYTRFDYEPTVPQRDRFRGLVRRAADHEPVAYLVGSKEFYSLALKVTPAVMIPRPETEIIVSEALGHLAGLGRPGFAWDVCTGSGCVAVAVAVNHPEVTVLATDVSADALAVAAQNAEAHGVARRVRFLQADLLDLPTEWGGPERFDLITANPPYVARDEQVAPEVTHEPDLAIWAGRKGTELLERIIDEAPCRLEPGGALIVEFGLGQADAVCDRMVDGGAFYEPHVVRDHQDLDRTAVAIRKP